jgi:hypothetical protein
VRQLCRLAAGPLDNATTSHRANGMNPVRTIELYRNEGSRNIDAIQLFYQGKVRWEGIPCGLPACRLPASSVPALPHSIRDALPGPSACGTGFR